MKDGGNPENNSVTQVNKVRICKNTKEGRDEAEKVHEVSIGKYEGESEWVSGLDTSVNGTQVETTVLKLRKSEVNGAPPRCSGAEYYSAENYHVMGKGFESLEGLGNRTDVPAAAFTTTTSRSVLEGEGEPTQAFHANEDLMGAFASYTYSGNPEEPKLVGGVATQAAQNHSPGNLGTKLIFMFTPQNSDELKLGAQLDENGCLIAMKHFQHIGRYQSEGEPEGEGMIGFFGADLTTQPEVNIYSLETKVNTLVEALEKIGLIKTVLKVPEGEQEGDL